MFILYACWLLLLTFTETNQDEVRYSYGTLVGSSLSHSFMEMNWGKFWYSHVSLVASSLYHYFREMSRYSYGTLVASFLSHSFMEMNRGKVRHSYGTLVGSSLSIMERYHGVQVMLDIHMVLWMLHPLLTPSLR